MDQLIKSIETANKKVNKADTSLTLARKNRLLAYETLAAHIQQLRKKVRSVWYLVTKLRLVQLTFQEFSKFI
jgi:hypothetical protein